MTKWSDCKLKSTSDLASCESYRALSLSSIKGTIDIPLIGILFVPDYKGIFEDEVVSVELQNGELVAEQKNANNKRYMGWRKPFGRGLICRNLRR